MRTSWFKRPLTLLSLVIAAGVLVSAQRAVPATAGTGWFNPTPIPRCEPTYDANGPALAISGSTVHLAWEEDGSDWYWLCRVFGDGSQWTQDAPIAGQSPAMAVGPDGSVHLVFGNDFDGTFKIYYLHWDGSSWGIPWPVSRTSGNSAYPSIAVGPDGTRYAAWADNTNAPDGLSEIYFGWSRDGISWSEAPVPNASGTRPQIAVDSSGAVHLVWEDTSGYSDHYQIAYNRCDGTPRCPDDAWLQPGAEMVSANPAADSLFPRIAIGRDDSVHVVWEEGTDSDTQVKVLYSTRLESGWDNPSELSGPDSKAFLPSLVIDKQGNRHVAWEQTAEILSRMWSAGTWGPAGRIASNPDGVRDPVVRYGPSMTLHAAWVQRGTDSRWGIYYSRRSLATHQLFLPFLARQRP